MNQILVIDDEPLFHRMIEYALEPLGCSIEKAPDGFVGLQKAHATQPDVIICDVMMPGITGYEVTRRLRREAAFAQTPILILTSEAEIQDKLNAFEVGADDHVAKPFDPAELAARVGVLLRRSEALKATQLNRQLRNEKARLIAVHSLRGGVGCSSIAVNLASALHELWGAPTLIMDLAVTAGQVALMLNSPIRRTWADLANCIPEELDQNVLDSVISLSGSNLQYMPPRPAPGTPSL